MMVYGEFLLESVKKTTETVKISGTDNTKYIEFKDMHYNKLNEIMSKLRYINKVKLEKSKSFFMTYHLFKDQNSNIP